MKTPTPPKYKCKALTSDRSACKINISQYPCRFHGTLPSGSPMDISPSPKKSSPKSKSPKSFELGPSSFVQFGFPEPFFESEFHASPKKKSPSKGPKSPKGPKLSGTPKPKFNPKPKPGLKSTARRYAAVHPPKERRIQIVVRIGMNMIYRTYYTGNGLKDNEISIAK